MSERAEDVLAETGGDRLRWGERIRVLLRSRGAMVVALILIFVGLILASLANNVSVKWLVSLTVWGIALGGVLALGSIGLTLIYGVVKFPNFAHGGLVSVGAYVAYTVTRALPGVSPAIQPFSFGWDLVLGLIVAVPIVGVVALALDRAVYRPLRNRGASLVLFAMASLAMAFFLRAMLYIIWGSEFHFYYLGRPNPALELPFGIDVLADQVFVVGFAAVLVFVIYLLLDRTSMGKAMRATADNPELARIRGINTERVIGWTWFMSGSLAAAGGVMYGLSSQLRPEMGWFLLLPMFAAVILGGIGNPRGALLGAMIIGIIQQVSAAFISPAYGPAVAFILMIVTLLIRPQGLLGK